MSEKHQAWGWMLAVDFFFAGMGGAMLVIAAIIDLFIAPNQVSLLGNILGPLCMCVGCGFLILELGRPMQAWRVFMNPKAILTFGAWTMTIAIISGFAYASFGIKSSLIFWNEGDFLRHLLALVNIVTGLVVATYPGVLLGRHKGRPFWVGPGVMGLFLLSSMVTGLALHCLCAIVVPVEGSVLSSLPKVIAALLLVQALMWVGYLWIKASGTTAAESASAKRWINGDLAKGFKIYFMLIGTVVPMILFLTPIAFFHGLAALMVLFGGVMMRIQIVTSGKDRTFLPGELQYRSRLPKGDEKFLKKAWM
ncbi:polysulfide reductase NrfD [Desulfuromonas acetoxidans]|uniref:Polysulphide reductase, NrfD n=1 Tax=Desulfuromonas acetoxidans (strain DSM 684 / 11070) TaxID=281689 RepID=Q1K2I6_DESA6|nr:NrfD/PsrC family molybdoenzyme membrane anchor subunit [Desulfuromonas acetoxidans]EAT16895.1 Polysulphide reductase, NrfD [Desulfuromonas acetoxidans DSM 684]MBF0645525.1 polysulfide reductase NrfD [Desulfuromonas acetoxidans]NVD23841.1 polysulfide reductase NrfD [Desulfuromonas acetoxidans]NVE15762.1 polysulfide reductase NrfD [Desulfuromonas acetoxidans]